MATTLGYPTGRKILYYFEQETFNTKLASMLNTKASKEISGYQDSTKVVVSETGKDRICDNNLSSPIFNIPTITIIIAILALFLPQVLANYFKKRNEKKRLYDIEFYVKAFLQSLINPITSQITNMQNLAKSISDLKTSSIGHIENYDLATDSFNKINQQDLYTVFIENSNQPIEDNIKHFSNITHAISFIKSHLELSRINFATYIESRRSNDRKLKKSVDQIIGKWNEYFSKVKRDDIAPNEDTFLKGFADILSIWNKEKDSSLLEKTDEQLLDPLKKHCSTFSSDHRVPELISHVRDASYATSEIRRLTSNYFGVFTREATELEKNKEAILKALKYFE